MSESDAIKEIRSWLYEDVNKSYSLFSSELETDENKDYRRGFLAGRLFAQLQLKADIGELQDAARKQPTD